MANTVKTLKMLLLATLAVFAPIKTAIITAFALALIDTILGIIAAKKRGESINSAGLRRSIVKIFVYEAAIMLGYLTETYMTGPEIPVDKIITGFVGLTEITSIVENLNEITGSNLLGSLISKLGSQNALNK